MIRSTTRSCFHWFLRFSVCLLACCHPLHAGEPPAPLPKVLLIGDSISMAYHKIVVRELKGVADVSRIPGNGEYTGTGVARIDEWLGKTRWDVIHFNWGLWDMYGWEYAAEDRSPATYARRLDQLVTRMKQTGARLVWATTTPACPAAESTMRKRWNTDVIISPEQEKRYRDAALGVMKRHHVAVNDLYSLILPDLASLALAPDDVHFNAQGSETLGRQVARAIRNELDARLALTAPPVEALKAFRELGFGMFLHYNMATYHGKQWVEGYPCPSTFNPGGPINTDAWADAAKAAGMTYGVLTAKHVAGFCLWDCALTEYDIMNPKCPVQEDIVGKFVKSFTSRGLKAGIYYCWRSPGFADKFKVLPPECDPATHDLAAQIEFQKRQIAELVAKYPDAFYLWNDGLDDTIMTAEAAKAWLRSLRPGIIASGNWWDWNKKGQPFVDIAVTETRHFPATNTHPGETCWKLEQGWFWDEGAKPVVTADQIAREIHTAHSRNANFLLNVGPDRQGRIIDASRKILTEIPASLRNQP